MTTLTKKTVLESHIINGSANLNYNWEQFCGLNQEQKKQFIWSAFVGLGINDNYKYDTIGEDTFKDYFAIINSTPRKNNGKTRELDFNGVKINTSAQAITLMAYGDTRKGELAKIPFRNLDYKCKCEDYQDFTACLNIINQYNEFSASDIIRTSHKYLAITQFFGEQNPNNGKYIFDFSIGREGSPVFYVSFNEYFKTNVITDREGAQVYFDQYTGEDFKIKMKVLADNIKADEFSIETTPIFNKNYYTARFWFD